MITANQLSVKTRKGIPLLSDVSLNFPDGKLHVIIGPNGSGKTTLLRALAGLTTPATGSVTIDCGNICSMRPLDLASHVSYVESEHSTPFAYTVEDTILWGRWHKHRGFPDSRDRLAATYAAQDLGLEGFFNRPVTTLSLGERKKTHIAKSIASDVKHLIWDEPCAPLDVRASLELMTFAKKMTADGISIIVSIHDIGLALRFADTISILSKGIVIWNGLAGDPRCIAAIEAIYGIIIKRSASDEGLSINLSSDSSDSMAR